MSQPRPPVLPDQPDLLHPEPESGFDLAQYLHWVRRWWKLAAAACLVAMTGGVIHYLLTPKTYRSTATLQIERHTLAKAVSAQAPWLESFLDPEYYPTAYKQLGSRGLAERVVKRLGLPAEPAFNPPGSGSLARAAAHAAAVGDDEVLGALADRLRKGLKVEPVPRTQLVEVSYEDSSPAFAKRVANGFADAFIDMGIEYRFASAGTTSTFLDTRVEALEKEIADKEAKLQALSRRTNTVAMDSGPNSSLQRLQALDAAATDATNARLEKEAAYKGLLNAPPETIAGSLQPGLISTLRAEELKLERDYEAKLKVYKPAWPAVQALASEIEKSKRNLRAAVQEAVATARQSAYAAYATALGQERQLAAEIDKIKTQVMDQSSLGAEFRTLGEEIKTRRDLLDKLLRTQSETGVEAHLQDTRDSNVHILDRALTPARPFSPSLQTDLLYGLLIGLLLGVGTALVAELLDRAIRTPEEVERQLGLPMLAVIRDVEEAGAGSGTSSLHCYGYGHAGGERRAGPARIELVPHQFPRAQVSEAYRSLRTALLLSSAHKLKVVAVTSAAMGEGKTATTANLAIVLAQLGRPVLVVDADLRRPCLHQVFGTSNHTGLVSHLTGTAAAGEIVAGTAIPNLWITPAGPLAPAPSELLSSASMQAWLRAVCTRFEYVVVDTPPLLAVTDALVVGAIADGVVLTLHSGKVTREAARLCRDRLRQADVRILGAVLNRYRTRDAGRAERYHPYEAYGKSPAAAKQPTLPRAGSAA
ncbi:MAG TPA: polysaccharide biosynthesis tyrosine autokinase [Thermoanaerobaculia bacterium]|nr:polysaccharide biosynthesis tyrosine autokinase [Thermoanaerobaculia bacterium]